MGFLSKLFGTNGAYKKATKDLNNAKDLEMGYYKNLADMDQLQRSENQAALTEARELLSDSNRRAAARAAVTGATPESVSLSKQAATNAVAGITTDIARKATATKDQAMQNYLSANRQYTDAINNVRLQQAKAETEALGGLLEAGIGAATGMIGGKA